MKNTLPAAPSARAPRFLIKANGTVLTGAISFETTENSFYEADTFEAIFALSKLPAGYGAAWWSQTAPITIEIFSGFPSNPDIFSASDLASIFYGLVDTIAISLDRTQLSISGRDLTARFIDNKSDEKYPNLTASQIATKLAQAQGLTPVVTATTTRVGTYYQIDNVTLQDNRTLWDLLTYLAKQENFVVYTKGQELHFEPAPDLSGDPYVFEWVPGEQGGAPRGNFSSINLTRSLTLAKDITVTVRSWNARQKKAFVRKATVQHKSHAGDVQNYVFNIPGLTPDQAQQRATKLAQEFSKQERKVEIEGPADNLLQRTDPVQLRGTATSWDLLYFVESIARSMSPDEGYRWTVELKNHSPESEATP